MYNPHFIKEKKIALEHKYILLFIQNQKKNKIIYLFVSVQTYRVKVKYNFEILNSTKHKKSSNLSYN